MLGQHRHFFLRYETLEILPWLAMIGRVELRLDSIPGESCGQGEQVLHQLSLASQADSHNSLADMAGSTLTVITLMLLNSLGRVLECAELDISIHRLPRHALHDDMDRLLAIIQDTRGSAKDRNYLRLRGGEWYLNARVVSCIASICKCRPRTSSRFAGEQCHG